MANSRLGSIPDHGKPLGQGAKFILEVVLTHEGNDCLAWPYSRNEQGYGRLSVDDKMVRASRYVCMLVHGDPPTPKHHAAHSCGNGHLGCVAPRHLRWATPKQNYADRLEHGTHARSERNGKAKLTEDQAREILSLKGIRFQRQLASDFGVAEGTIANIHSGRTWSD
jgi:hypothetical protein